MLTATHKGKRICSLDLKNIYGKYEYKMLEELRIASENKELRCEECGQVVFLRAGDIKIPHFAHITLTKKCFFNKADFIESEEHKKGKLVLYKYFKEFFARNNIEALVEVDYKLPNGRRANIYVEKSNKKFAYEYLKDNISLNDWQKKHKDYREMNVQDCWILSNKQYKRNNDANRIFFKQYIENYQNDQIIKLLDTDTSELILMKYLEYRDKNKKLVEEKEFEKKYILNNEKCYLSKANLIEDFLKDYKSAQEKYYDEMEQYFMSLKVNHLKANNIIRAEVDVKKEIKKKDISILKEEALASKKNNPEGNWYDSTNNDRWGICEVCSEFTNDWVYFDGMTNLCLCRECNKKKSNK